MGREDSSTAWTSILDTEILDIHCDLRIAACFLSRTHRQIPHPSDPHKPHTQGSNSAEKPKGPLAKHMCKLVNDFVQMAEGELSF